MSYFLTIFYGEYNNSLVSESILGFTDENQQIGNVKKAIVNELDKLFNIYDSEGSFHILLLVYTIKFIIKFLKGSGLMTFDKIVYFFLILYVSSIDADETCDLFFIKREFQRFLSDIKEFKAKVNNKLKKKINFFKKF